MGIPKQATRSIAPKLGGLIVIRIGAFATGEEALSTEEAFAAGDRERNNDAVAWLRPCRAKPTLSWVAPNKIDEVRRVPVPSPDTAQPTISVKVRGALTPLLLLSLQDGSRGPFQIASATIECCIGNALSWTADSGLTSVVAALRERALAWIAERLLAVCEKTWDPDFQSL